MNDRRRVETVHEGSLFQVQALTVQDRNGRSVRREIVRHPGAVVIVPVLDGGNLVMIRNDRIAVNERLLEFPAGKLECGEAPICAAARELEEETGYHAHSIRPLGTFYTFPGFADELMHVFVAEGLTHVGQRLETGEDIAVQIVSRDDAIQMARNDHPYPLRDGKTLAALFMWYVQEFKGSTHLNPRDRYTEDASR